MAECTIVLGRQGLRSNEFFDESFLKAQPINLIEAEDDAGNWDNMTFLYPELRDAGPPITLQRSIRFLGPNAFEDGGPQGFQARLSENIIPGQGSWPTHVNLTAERGIVVPSTVAAEADASVGDRVDVLRFHYAVDAVLLPEQFETSTCEGTIQTGENGYQYCMLTAELRNTTILGIYKPWDLGNPSLGPNPIFTSWSILDNATTRALIDADHMYLGIALDRAAIPTESTRVAGEYIEAIAALIDDGTYAELSSSTTTSRVVHHLPQHPPRSDQFFDYLDGAHRRLPPCLSTDWCYPSSNVDVRSRSNVSSGPPNPGCSAPSSSKSRS